MRYAWICRCCGQSFDELPLSFGFDAPDPWFALSEADRQSRAEISSDGCVIDGRAFFIRGCLPLPIVNSDDIFVWNVWVSLSEKSFARVGELWDVAQRAQKPPLSGWLSNHIPVYPPALLAATVHLRDDGLRPSIMLQEADHPLWREQRDGITLDRVAEIAAQVMRHDVR